MSNFNKLIAHKVSVDAIPPGGGFADGVALLIDKEKFIATTRAAVEWVKQAIELVRTAPGSQWREASDEEIATEILRQVDAKKGWKR